MKLIDIYIELLKNYKLIKTDNIREKGISLKKLRKMRMLEKLRAEEREKRLELISDMYGNKKEGL